jgi:hypothetical protein
MTEPVAEPGYVTATCAISLYVPDGPVPADSTGSS